MIPESTRTFENLNAALAGEARLAFLYRLWAERAQADGQYATAQLFDTTAKNEISHARLWYHILHDQAPDTLENLNRAAGLEKTEWSESYATFARVAREEGFDDVAVQFDLVAGIEAQHEQRYRRQLSDLQSGAAIHAPGAEWICQECGYHVTADDAPQTCPVCGKGAGWFGKKGC